VTTDTGVRSTSTRFEFSVSSEKINTSAMQKFGNKT
jgi:hypothetical protein